MKNPLPLLGAFVAGVFAGAGMWFALILCMAGLVVWWVERASPGRDLITSSLKHIEHLGPRPRDRGR